MAWLQDLENLWRLFVAGLTLLLSLVAAGHALLFKRDTRGAVLWVGFICLVPLIGAILYLMLGINRIKRHAVLLRGNLRRYRVDSDTPAILNQDLSLNLPSEVEHLSGLARTMDSVLGRPLLPGNRIDLLVNGDAAFPAMLEAIQNARQSITLSTYIFDRDAAGLAFAQALGQAVRRGVEVRVLMDATGTRYSWPTIRRTLDQEGVRHALFLPSFQIGQLISFNLRNHRKLLIVDGQTAFTGGMNIRIGHWLSKKPAHPVQDLQFKVQGPVVAQLQEVFTDDWFFTTEEALRGEPWFVPLQPAGHVLSRGIVDGPDEDFEKLRWTILAALTMARRSVRILTPYFLPDQSILSALNLAAMRGVEVDIVLPSKNNLPFVQWASIAHWWQVLEHGCAIWLTPPPFDHSKLFLIDEGWALVGSTNWDPRSLRLNFEFNLECYDRDLAAQLGFHFESKRGQARRVTLEEVNRRSLPLKLRDGVARLLTPFL